jgi:hypothetical protein
MIVLEGSELLGEGEVVGHAFERDALERDTVLDGEFMDALHMGLGAAARAQGAFAILGGEGYPIGLELLEDVGKLFEERCGFLGSELFVADLVVHGFASLTWLPMR